MILRVTRAMVVGPAMLRLTFSNGNEKIVDTSPLLNGPIFAPLQDKDYFALAALDPICGTVVWPNGADFAPEALHALDHRPKEALA